MSLVIGLTGPTGAGKSSVTSVAEELGFKVIDCDKVARVALEKGSSGLDAVAEVFGNDILNEDGSLNRAALAQKAFSTRENTELLNKTVFPYITDLVKQEITDNYVANSQELKDTYASLNKTNQKIEKLAQDSIINDSIRSQPLGQRFKNNWNRIFCQQKQK